MATATANRAARGVNAFDVIWKPTAWMNDLSHWRQLFWHAVALVLLVLVALNVTLLSPVAAFGAVLLAVVLVKLAQGVLKLSETEVTAQTPQIVSRHLRRRVRRRFT